VVRIALALATVVAGPLAAPDVSHIVLKPTQVGKDYVLLTQKNGNLVKGQVTLNLCGTGYASELLRTTRLQVNFASAKSPVAISNEVVTYRGRGAAQAMREVTRRAATCPHTPIDSGSKGVPKLTFKLTPVKDAHLLKGYLAVRVDVTGTVKGKRVAQTSYAIYQQHGNLLSGIYSFGGGPAAQLKVALHAAEQSALNRRRGSSGAPSGPTA
jgi:hypothetical protein